MLKFCSLYSGSSGNCLFVSSNNTKILIDCGTSCKKICDGLEITILDFFSSPLFENLEQEIK
jgi:phosphoribosyl 1,2-cyclic phosphodiesterase